MNNPAGVDLGNTQTIIDPNENGTSPGRRALGGRGLGLCGHGDRQHTGQDNNAEKDRALLEYGRNIRDLQKVWKSSFGVRLGQSNYVCILL